jgi:hypothetical protein
MKPNRLIAIVTMLVLTGCAQPQAPVTPSPSTYSPPTAAPPSPPPTAAPCTEPIGPVGCLTTVAGGGREFKDGGKARSAALCEPSDIAVDGAGNLYIANAGVHCSGPAANRVVKVDPQGILTIFAGTGEVGFSGDGGPAASAQLLHPVWVAVDRAGNVYIADTSNYRIRKVDTAGIITTFAGTGEAGFSGDGGPAAEAQLFAGGQTHWCDIPGGMDFDAEGNLYLADGGAVRKIDATGTITTVAGGERSGYYGDGKPTTEARLCASDVAVDQAGNLYISGGGEVVRRVDRDGVIRTVAGGVGNTDTADGVAANYALLLSPWGVAVDSQGNLFITEHRTSRIRRVGADGLITTVAGILHHSSGGRGLFNGEAGLATEIYLNEPVGLFIDDADVLYIADTFNARIRKVRFAGAP